MKRIDKVNIAIVVASVIGLIMLMWVNLMRSRYAAAPVATQHDIAVLHNRLNKIVDIRISGIERKCEELQVRERSLSPEDVLDQLNGAEGELNGKIESLREFTRDLWDRVEDGNKPTIETTAPKVISGVVHIKCPGWQGSGFVVGPRLIATARHVVEGVTDFTITTNDGHKIRATRAISFKEHDIGFVWIDDLHCVSEKERELECAKLNHEVKLSVLELAPIKECRIGQTVFSIGSTGGKIHMNSVAVGNIQRLDLKLEDFGVNKSYGWAVLFGNTAEGGGGNSGCPLFTLDGKVIGVWVGSQQPNVHYCIPTDLFKDRLTTIVSMFEMGQFRFEEQVSKIEQPKPEPNSVCVVTVSGDQK